MKISMKRLFLLSLLPAMSIIFFSCTNNGKGNMDNIVIESEQVKLIISTDGTTKSLVYKPTNEECLIRGGKHLNIFCYSGTTIQ